MKKSIMILIISVLLSNKAYAEGNEETKKLVNTMYNSSVSIFSTGTIGSGICSGVVIKNTSKNSQVLTAKHCSDVFEETYVEGIRVAYSIESSDDDLAILILNEKILDKVAITFANKSAKRKDIVYHLGFPQIKMFASIGIVWINSLDHSYAILDVMHGCSGGGVFNDRGELVGVLFGMMTMTDSIALYEPLPDITRFLKTIGL